MVVVLLLVPIASCGSASMEQGLRQRASYDLQCPEGRIHIRHLDDGGAPIVYGCGHSAPYVSSCDGPRYEFASTCTWTRDGEITEQAMVESTP